MRNLVGKQFRAALCLVTLCKSCCDFLLLVDVNEWMSYKCSDVVTTTQNKTKIAAATQQKMRV